MTKTYDCKKAISNSKKIIASTINHGNKAIVQPMTPDPNSVQEKPIRIFNRACPLIMLANNRMLRLKTLAI
jgi:hypothetical protein